MSIYEPPGLIEYADVTDVGPLVSVTVPARNDIRDYRCAGCGSLLFDGEDSIQGGEGRAFFAPVDPAVLTQHRHWQSGTPSVELRCAACDSHVGHVYPDGPWPTGLRYQIDDAPALAS